MAERLHSEVTDAIICGFYNVYNSLGYGFLEKVYENALCLELRRLGLAVEQQFPITVSYLDQMVGEYFCDLLVENNVFVEIKAVKNQLPEHEAQLLNYLKATNVEVGLLMNFGPKPEIKRKAFSNGRK